MFKMNYFLFILTACFVIKTQSKVLCEGNCSSSQKEKNLNRTGNEYSEDINKKQAQKKRVINTSDEIENDVDVDLKTHQFEEVEVQQSRKNIKHSTYQNKIAQQPLVGKKYAARYLSENSNLETDAELSEQDKREEESQFYSSSDLKSNLPMYFTQLRSPVEDEVSFVMTPKSEAKNKLAFLFPGSILKIKIDQDIIASEKVNTPVVGLVLSGPYKGSKIYGEVRLEEDLKRVLFDFKSISGGKIQNEYSVKARGLDILGRVGYVGRYHADDLMFGIASFFATATAIATDSQVNRSKNRNGDWVDEPSAENALKKGLAGSVGKVAERLSDRAINAQGRTEIQGPLFVQVILDETPFLKR